MKAYKLIDTDHYTYLLLGPVSAGRAQRERIIRWGPRTLDLDIIFYDDIISYDEHILIPHPRAHERQFVMKPMCDINPYFVHPVYRKRVMDISSELGDL